ncbi:hypothetical protein [Fibrivirga algicola]|uniref:Outer membrane protein assembly factor BamE n=1 Tax=Fibrivirga algicola TaxID=2950420 RepID=A0ABX0QP94_9BACT|nr:hypothetical protein [Fibrivirga algicola]NID12975.1 hypothetical protein [Fibrivirga algicola]
MHALLTLVAVCLSGTAALCSSSVETERVVNARTGINQPTLFTPVPDYETVSKLSCGESTQQTVRLLLGTPTDVSVGAIQSEWMYRRGKTSVHIVFDAEKKVVAYSYQAPPLQPSAELAIEQIKLVKAGDTEAELIRLLGEPTYASVSLRHKEVSYNSTPRQASFQVKLNTSKPTFVVAEYLFTEPLKKSASTSASSVLTADNVLTLEQGKTSLADVVQAFGTPAQRTISLKDEQWFYESAEARLMLQFSRSLPETLLTYQYNTKAAQK